MKEKNAPNFISASSYLRLAVHGSAMVRCLGQDKSRGKRRGITRHTRQVNLNGIVKTIAMACMPPLTATPRQRRKKRTAPQDLRTPGHRGRAERQNIKTKEENET